MTAKEVFQKLLQRSLGWRLSASLARKKPTGPGKLVEALAPEERQALATLTIADVDDDLVDPWYFAEPNIHDERNNQLFTDFDKKLSLAPARPKLYESR